MYCNNCHFEFKANDLKCPACGSEDIVPVAEKPENKQPEAAATLHEEAPVEKKRGHMPTFIMGIVCVILGSGLSYFGLTSYDRVRQEGFNAVFSTGGLVYPFMARLGFILAVYGGMTIVVGIIRTIIDSIKDKKK